MSSRDKLKTTVTSFHIFTPRMMEARFSCSFCLRYDCSLRCPDCNLAPYCSDFCMVRDLHRHKQLECTHFTHRAMCALCRKTLSAPTVDCQYCYNVTYCSTECHDSHVTAHSIHCLTARQSIVTNAKKKQKYMENKLPSVPPYIGQTPALDYLQLRHNEGSGTRELNLLLVSFTDIRNVIKTVVDLPTDFTGRITFYLHEQRPHLMARNILFLYLAITNPWPQFMTQIWYSSKLTEKCFRYITTAIYALTCSYDKTFKAMRGIVALSRDQWKTCCAIWLGWLQFAFKDASKGVLLIDRQRERRIGSWSLTPSAHQMCCSMPVKYQGCWKAWFEDGLLLPMRSVERVGVCRLNPTLLCFNPCKGERYEELRSCKVGLQLAEVVDEQEEMIYGVPSNCNVFAAWDFIQVKSAVGNHMQNDLLEMYSQYINTLIYSFCKAVSRGMAFFYLLDCPLESISKNIDTSKMDRICAEDVEENYLTPEVLNQLRPLLKTTNPHSVVITRHELWYEANELDRCGNMTIREPALLLALRDVDVRPYVLEQVDVRKSDVVRRFWSCSDDYLDIWPLVYRYLQGEIYIFCSSLDEKSGFKQTLNVEEFARQLGFHFRLFFRENHGLVPFRLQTNTRRISIQKSNFVCLEWKPIPVLSSV